jgi:hypothetical protein
LVALAIWFLTRKPAPPFAFLEESESDGVYRRQERGEPPEFVALYSLKGRHDEHLRRVMKELPSPKWELLAGDGTAMLFRSQKVDDQPMRVAITEGLRALPNKKDYWDAIIPAKGWILVQVSYDHKPTPDFLDMLFR